MCLGAVFAQDFVELFEDGADFFTEALPFVEIDAAGGRFDKAGDPVLKFDEIPVMHQLAVIGVAQAADELLDQGGNGAVADLPDAVFDIVAGYHGQGRFGCGAGGRGAFFMPDQRHFTENFAGAEQADPYFMASFADPYFDLPFFDVEGAVAVRSLLDDGLALVIDIAVQDARQVGLHHVARVEVGMEFAVRVIFHAVWF